MGSPVRIDICKVCGMRILSPAGASYWIHIPLSRLKGVVK